MRRKIIIFIGPTIPEDVCGVPDSVLADYLRFDLPPVKCPDGIERPVLAFRHCPWCGAVYTPGLSETRTTVVSNPPPERDPEQPWRDDRGEQEYPTT